MSQVSLTIDNKEVSVKPGTTILEAARSVGIDIPTLCHHRALVPVGACRVCVVEVEGQRTLQASCVFPVTAGMNVQTESPRVVQARKFILDMLFSERNHFCPFCETSGDCELQNLGYRYGLDHWVYQTYTKAFPVDASRQYFLMDHNRCVLCGRCIRACSEIAANHTLGLRQRGAKSMINADTNTPFGGSTCISCGTCLQVCPTGAIFDSRSSFMGREAQSEVVKSTCSQCSVGCGIELITRGGNLLRVRGDWEGEVNKGAICKHGRFEPLNEGRNRLLNPMIRRKGKLQPVSWSEALQAVAKRLEATEAKAVGVLTSSNATNEALFLLEKLFCKELKVNNVGLLNEAAPKLAGQRRGMLNDLVQSDLILVVGVDPAKDQPVSSFFVKRAVDKGARLIVVDSEQNGLVPFAFMNVEMKNIQKAVEIAERAENPFVLYGAGMTEDAAKVLNKLQKKAAFAAIEPGVNTRAAVAFGFNNGFKPASSKTLYVLMGEADGSGEKALQSIDKKGFVVVQASYVSPLIERADVVLPTAIWSERTGSLTNTEGRVLKANRAVDPEGDAKPDWEILSLLAGQLGKSLPTSFDDLSARASNELKRKEI